jgi:uncharacterized damage-inducible protein DinB
MTDRETLIQLSNLAWETLRGALDGLAEGVAWASVDCQPGEYLNTEGSILSQIAHVANGKIIYASVGFRNTDVRWRDLSPKVDSLWPSLDAIVAWLYEAHEYWMKSWAEIEDFHTDRPHFTGNSQPAWKLIATGIHHDHYHAGQIQLMRSMLAPSATPPPPEGALWKKYCKGFPCW